ncbi:hypothetical protein VTK26DRAFT_6816 [Humicola hyalothermophila]
MGIAPTQLKLSANCYLTHEQHVRPIYARPKSQTAGGQLLTSLTKSPQAVTLSHIFVILRIQAGKVGGPQTNPADEPRRHSLSALGWAWFALSLSYIQLVCPIGFRVTPSPRRAPETEHV